MQAVERFSTGMKELDTVLGGGLVPGSSTLFVGRPGVGVTTLLIQAMNAVAQDARRNVLYYSGEQSAAELVFLARRLGATNENIDVVGNNGDVFKIVSIAERKKRAALVVDSVNTAFCDDVDADVNSERQIEFVAIRLAKYGKVQNAAVLMVCHAPLSLSGTSHYVEVAEHLVDTVIHLKLDPDDPAMRVLVSGKNRFGERGARETIEFGAQGFAPTTVLK